MRAILILVLLIPLCAAQAVDLPVFVSGGVGKMDWMQDRSLSLNANIALLIRDRSSKLSRLELVIGAWYLRETHHIISMTARGNGEYDHTIEQKAFYQAIKISTLIGQPFAKSSFLEIGMGLGIHEENPEGDDLALVPRAHFSTRFHFFPSYTQSPFLDVEAMPQLANEDYDCPVFVRLGYNFHI